MEGTLSPEQSAALLDILSHHNTYAEIQDFKLPGSLTHYGPPFTAESEKFSTSPALQGLVSKFLLDLPGLRDVPEEFWKVQLHEIIEGFEGANLSESYDKGAVGTRKTMATAISALIEYPVRGTCGGFSKVPEPLHQYDLSKANDLAHAFRDFMDKTIYSTALDDLVERTAETDKLSEHEPLTQAVHEFLLVNVASFMHYTIILSPKGQYLIKLLGNANKLVPYTIIRQTLKIGNVASMINAMMKVVLAKMSVTSVTNWMGLTQSEDTGLNLMQQDLESRASKIEKESDGPSKEHIECLKEFSNKPREEQEVIRQHSRDNSVSIVVAILAFSSCPTDISPTTHALALEYLAVHLSVRDRREIIRVLCHSTPDHVTSTVKTLVSAYDPIIRGVHNSVDLSDTLSDFQSFLSDTLKLSKLPTPSKSSKDEETAVPTVGDFVQLLKKHQYSCHKFVHQCCKNGKELTEWYLEWAKKAASHFRRDTDSDPTIRDTGHLTKPLNELFSHLPSAKKKQIIPVLDVYAMYVDELHTSSNIRLESVLQSPPSKNPAICKVLAASPRGSRPPSPAPSPTSAQTPSLAGPSTDPGPGAYLARWQDLLDNTLITPSEPTGKVQTGSSKKLLEGSPKYADRKRIMDFKEENSASKVEKVKGPVKEKPDVGVVVEALGGDFRKLLAERSVYW